MRMLTKNDCTIEIQPPKEKTDFSIHSAFKTFFQLPVGLAPTCKPRIGELCCITFCHISQKSYPPCFALIPATLDF